MKNLISGLLCLFLITSPGYSQETSDEYNQRKIEMLQEEAKIAVYIAKHLNDDIPQEELNRFNNSLLNHDGHNHDKIELTLDDRSKLLENFKKMFWRNQYFVINPSSLASYSPRVVAGSCANGDFETGDFAGYSGGFAYGTNGYNSGGDCTITTGDFTFTTVALNTAHVADFDIMTVGNDPLVTNGTLPRVFSGSFSARLNSNINDPHTPQNYPNFSVSRLTKDVVLSSVNEVISFRYALVMTNPSGHNNAKPTFKARLLDDANNECDWLCTSSYVSDPFLIQAVSGSNNVLYKQWACGSLQACGNIGDTVTLEFLMTDCAAGGHWGYAYLDDICDTCTIDTCNFTGSIDLNPTDTCIGDTMQVCGVYNLASINCSTAVADEIRLYIYQNGVQVGSGPIATNTSPSGGTFCFTVSSADFPSGATGGYDFYAEIDFDFGTSGTAMSNDINTNPGQNNDYIFNPQCCPEFDIFTCCDLTPSALKSSPVGSIPSVPTVSTKIQSKLDAYRSAVKAAYPVKSAVNGDPCCDFCEYPNVAFPIFIYDESGNLISDVTYSISWSNDPLNTTAIGSALPDVPVIVTVSGPDSCVWSDTFLLECCDNPGNDGFCCDTIDFEVDIDSVCNFDPCKFPTASFPIRVLRNGTVLTTAGYSFQWSTGANSSAISVTLAQLPVSVIVTDLTTGCIDTGYYDINCCTPVVPTNLNCLFQRGNQTLTWNAIPGVTYELEMNYNDTRCCRTGIPPTGIRYTLTTNSYSGPFAHSCFSWRVRSICPDGTKSAWSNYECSCAPPPCVATVPTNLRCTVTRGGQLLTWDAIPGATYQVAISWNDPACCRNGQIGFSQIFNTTNPSHLINNLTGCFSWRVRSVCPDGTVSAWSSTSCSCSGTVVIGTGGTGLSTKINTQTKGKYNADMEVSLAPNPARDFVTFNIVTKDSKAELGSLVITSLTGETVFTSQVKLNGSTMVDLDNLTAGTYVYKVISDGTYKSGRIVITD